MKRILTYQGAASAVVSVRALAAVLLPMFFLPATPLLAASPDFSTTIPRGGQRGEEVRVVFHGNRLDDAEDLIFHLPGITLKEMKPLDARKFEAVLKIAPDAHLGEHHIRVRCKSGISFARNFWVSQFPNVDEVEPNDDFDDPQKIDLNVTVEAEAKTEETDYYQVSAKKGQRLSVEVEGLRINSLRQQIAVDPYVSIFNRAGDELASADGSALLRQDSILSIVVPEDGEYVVEVRDAAYQGRGRYRAHIGTFPRPTAIYPAGGEAGKEVEFTLIGDVKGDYKVKATLPQETVDGTHGIYGESEGLFPPSPNPVRVSSFRNAMEAEPNNSSGEATDAGELPVAFNGILQEPGDEDYFKFTAKKNQSFVFRVFAETIGTPVDSVMTIYDSEMKAIESNDDADGSKDSRINFRAPDDGEFFVRIRDMLGRGGRDFIYRVEAIPATPTIDVTMPEMLRRELQYDKQFDVPRGSHFAMIVNTRRSNLAGELVFDMPELPPGVKLVAGTMPRTVSQFPIILEADADAPIGGGMYDLLVRNTDEEKPVVGRFMQSLDLVRGPQNGVEYYTKLHNEVPVAVIEELPFRVSIEQPKAPIVRNGTKKLKVIAHRDEDYDRPITVRLLWKPPGISSPATMTFKEGETELEYELNANDSAELNTWNITVQAYSDGGKGRMVTASPFVQLAVEEPFVDLKLTMATASQGESTNMLAEVEALRDFDGKADVKLFGLPAHATASSVQIDKTSEAASFAIETTEKTVVGQHKNVFATVTMMKDGEPVEQRVGMGGVIRIDPAPKEPKPVAEVAKSEPAKEKPLSRLEQLRLEAQQQSANE